MKCYAIDGRCRHRSHCEHACYLRVAPVKYDSEQERVFYEGFKSLDDPTAPLGIMRLRLGCGIAPKGLLAIAERLANGIITGHDWPNTQDELDRLSAARVLRWLAAASGSPSEGATLMNKTAAQP